MTALEIQRKAIEEVGDLGENALYEIRLPLNLQGGYFSLGFAGENAPNIPFNSSSEELKSHLESLDNIRLGNVDVWGTRRGPYRVEMIGELAATPLPLDTYPLTGDGSTLEPAGAVTVEQIKEGDAPELSTKAAQSYAYHAAKENVELIYLYVKRDLLNLLIGRAKNLVDSSENNIDKKLRQRYLNLLSERDAVQGLINGMESSDASLVGRSDSFRMMTAKIIKRTPNGAPYGKMIRNGDGSFT